jgi:Family of unknown function (DUF6221)
VEALTLTEFLAARLDEREADARTVLAFTARSRESTGLGSTLWDEQDAGTRMELREVRAGRALVAMHEPDRDPADEWYGDDVRCKECGGYNMVAGYGAMGFSRSWPCRTLRAMVSVYSDHPDYDEAWAP